MAADQISVTQVSLSLSVSPARCVVLDCSQVSSIDYTVVNELQDLLKNFQLQGVALVFTGLKVSRMLDTYFTVQKS